MRPKWWGWEKELFYVWKLVDEADLVVQRVHLTWCPNELLSNGLAGRSTSLSDINNHEQKECWKNAKDVETCFCMRKKTTCSHYWHKRGPALRHHIYPSFLSSCCCLLHPPSAQFLQLHLYPWNFTKHKTMSCPQYTTVPLPSSPQIVHNVAVLFLVNAGCTSSTTQPSCVNSDLELD